MKWTVLITDEWSTEVEADSEEEAKSLARAEVAHLANGDLTFDAIPDED